MTKKEKTRLQKDVVSSVDDGESGRLILAPRSGKTKMIIDIIKRDKIVGDIVWVTPTKKLAEEDLPLEFEVWKAKKYLKNLKTVTWKGLKDYKGVPGLLVLDEDQHMTVNNIKTLVEGDLQPKRILSMTGTESKHEAKQELYKFLGLEVLYRISINQGVDAGLLSNYTINVVNCNLDDKLNIEVKFKDKQKVEKSFMTSELKQYEYLNRKLEQNMTKFGIIQRRRLIGNSPTKLKAAKYLINSLGGKKLIFATDTKQADKLCEHTYHGKTDDTDLKKFVKGDIQEIAMVNKGGTGYTYKLIDHLFIIQSDSDSNGLTSQKITRTLLGQKDYTANIWIICLEGTQDVVWVNAALSRFDKEKINFINFNNLVL